jgi:Lar family restriction alleviation protein
MTDLLPCPFCGGEAALSDHVDRDTRETAFWEVSCASYSCDVFPSTTDADQSTAIAAWNRRTTALPPIEGQIHGGCIYCRGEWWPYPTPPSERAA